MIRHHPPQLAYIQHITLYLIFPSSIHRRRRKLAAGRRQQLQRYGPRHGQDGRRVSEREGKRMRLCRHALASAHDESDAEVLELPPHQSLALARAS